MSQPQQSKPKNSPRQGAAKPQMHKRNLHRTGYDFKALCKEQPQLQPFVHKAKHGRLTIDFANPEAVLLLNQALLAMHYDIRYWQIPKEFLCPPIPGRADSIHYLADILAHTATPEKPARKRPLVKGEQVRVLDIGTGANCIYPLIGHQTYGWQFVGSDIDVQTLRSARTIVRKNPGLQDAISVRQQKDPQAIFRGLIQPEDRFDLSLCNPPFHDSAAAAKQGSQQKWHNLKHKGKQPQRNPAQAKKQSPVLNFGGQHHELWCQGGELSFLKRMTTESRQFAQQVLYFSTLVSKRENLNPLKKRLQKLDATHIEVIDMAQGNKMSRMLVWSFLSDKQRRAWAKQHWQVAAKTE